MAVVIMKKVQVARAGGSFEVTEEPMREPAPGYVRVKVQACGICHSDALTKEGGWPGIAYPRSPGHEIAGVIDALGEGADPWKIDDRVGIGWHGGHCGKCDSCRRGDFITCARLQIPGIGYDGGYAEFVFPPIVALAHIPDELTPDEAAPLMCAGVTTFNALRHSGARPGDLVAIQGIGGLGHLGVQFASKFGFATVAIGRGSDKKSLALKLGARDYIDGRVMDVAKELSGLGDELLVQAGDTKIGDLGMAFLRNQDVCRFDVTVNYALRMCIIQGFRDFVGELKSGRQRQLAVLSGHDLA